MKRIIGIICFLSSLWSCSPLADELSDETKDEWTSRLTWSGDTDRFKISNEGLRLNDEEKADGSAFLTTPSSTIRGTRWEFRVHLFFNPSASNYARFYLASSFDRLSGGLNGYFLQIGGSKDQVSLYRQEGLDTKLLASGRELMKGNNSPDMRIKVECDNNGYWTFWTCLKEEEGYVKEKQVRDVSFTQSRCAGVYCFYTATRSKGFLFSHIQITPDAVDTTTKPDEPTLPEKPEKPEEPGEATKGVLFNEVMYHHATGGDEYIELYNHSTKVVSLAGWQLEKQNIAGTTLGDRVFLTNGTSTPITIAPGAYLCFTGSVQALVKKHQANEASLVKLPFFPSLSNKGGVLLLLNNQGQEIDRCFFSNDAHSTPKKEAVGISLERCSPYWASNSKANWLSSKHQTGGTPGKRNSVTEEQ